MYQTPRHSDVTDKIIKHDRLAKFHYSMFFLFHCNFDMNETNRAMKKLYSSANKPKFYANITFTASSY